jgi:hypothetical protein
MSIYTFLSFFFGLGIGVLLGSLRFRARLRLYKFFVEERLSMVNASELPPVLQKTCATESPTTNRLRSWTA